MKRGTIILLAVCLSGTAVLQAQELPAGERPRQLPIIPASQLWQPSQALLPTFGQALPGIRRPEEQATSVILRQNNKSAHMQERTLNREARLWKATIGNTSMNNWSPFPDRALDARIIRYPLPRK